MDEEVEGVDYGLGEGLVAKVWRVRPSPNIDLTRQVYADIARDPDTRCGFSTPEIIDVDVEDREGALVTYERELPGALARVISAHWPRERELRLRDGDVLHDVLRGLACEGLLAWACILAAVAAPRPSGTCTDRMLRATRRSSPASSPVNSDTRRRFSPRTRPHMPSRPMASCSAWTTATGAPGRGWLHACLSGLLARLLAGAPAGPSTRSWLRRRRGRWHR